MAVWMTENYYVYHNRIKDVSEFEMPIGYWPKGCIPKHGERIKMSRNYEVPEYKDYLVKAVLTDRLILTEC